MGADLLQRLHAAPEMTEDLFMEVWRTFPETHDGGLGKRINRLAFAQAWTEASLSLVPEGWWPSMGADKNEPEWHGNDDIVAWAELIPEEYDGYSIMEHAGTIPLALCAALVVQAHEAKES